jgi:hypothetical protein
MGWVCALVAPRFLFLRRRFIPFHTLTQADEQHRPWPDQPPAMAIRSGPLHLTAGRCSLALVFVTWFSAAASSLAAGVSSTAPRPSTEGQEWNVPAKQKALRGARQAGKTSPG